MCTRMHAYVQASHDVLKLARFGTHHISNLNYPKWPAVCWWFREKKQYYYFWGYIDFDLTKKYTINLLHTINIANHVQSENPAAPLRKCQCSNNMLRTHSALIYMLRTIKDFTAHNHFKHHRFMTMAVPTVSKILQRSLQIPATR